MRPCLLLVLSTAILLVGCERVTAPRALQIADETEQKLLKEWNGAVLGQISMAENDFNPGWPDSARSMVLVSKDDAADQLEGVVIDRVFVPPKGFGEPVSRRSFIAWFHSASYGVVAVTESSDHSAGAFGDYDKPQERDELHPRTLLVAPHERNEDWWLGREGRGVVIEPLESSNSCPFASGGADAAADSLLTCEVVTYTVQVDGDLIRRLDAHNALIPEAMKQHHRIAVPSQRVRGLRFTLRCHPTELVTKWQYQLGCTTSPFIFWRNNALFAGSLGVDISQMKRLNNGGIGPGYGRTLQPGSDKQPAEPHRVQWKLFDTDGTLVDQDTTINYTPSPEFKPTYDQSWLGYQLERCVNGMGYGGRRQCLIDQIGHSRQRSRYGLFVLDVEDVAR